MNHESIHKTVILTAVGSRADKAGSRADEGRGDYQERAAAESGDETESESSVCGVVCVVTRGPPDCRRLS